MAIGPDAMQQLEDLLAVSPPEAANRVLEALRSGSLPSLLGLDESTFFQALLRRPSASDSLMSTTAYALLQSQACANALTAMISESHQQDKQRVVWSQQGSATSLLNNSVSMNSMDALESPSPDVGRRRSGSTRRQGGNPSDSGVAPTSEELLSHPAVLRLLEPGDVIRSAWSCSLVSGMDALQCVLFLCQANAYLLPGFTLDKQNRLIDLATVAEAEKQVDPDAMADAWSQWNYEDVRDIRRARYLLQDRALELFSSVGNNTLISFNERAARESVYTAIIAASPALAVRAEDSVAGMHRDAKIEQGFLGSLTGGKTITQRWVDGEISNFQYLMSLNTLAGRSYNDLNQYPVFPFVLKDYESQELDLDDPSIYRDLSKPMGAQTANRAEGFKLRYEAWDDTLNEETPAFHYGTHYSSAAAVASYLVRLEPFCQLFLEMQGGHFDHPDRMFYSIADTWESASEKSNADVKELTPEFFYLPEFLVNSNRFDLGTKQGGERLDDVILPPWAKGDPTHFIRVHRAALESDYVSRHLHLWIDLIFGSKQRGPEAIAALNVFHHLTYEGAVDIDALEDPVQRAATIGIINNFGQTPKQLFRKPHPAKKAMHHTVSNRAISARSQLNNMIVSPHPIRQITSPVGQIQVDDNGKCHAAAVGQRLQPPGFMQCLDFNKEDGSVVSFDISTDRGEAIFYEGMHPDSISCALIPAPRTLITGSADTTLRVWSVSGKRQVSFLCVSLA
jgi:hypothetical protein